MTLLWRGRSLYGIAAASALLVTGGTLSLVASARQSPPSAAQAKKAATAAPSPSANKQVALPGFGSPAASGSSSAGAHKDGSPELIMDVSDLNAKTSLAKGKNVTYTEGEMKFSALSAIYNDNSKQLDAQGNLDLDDPKHHVTGDKSHVDRIKQLAIITGSVVITLKPTPPDPNVPDPHDSAKQRQSPVIITCDRAEDFVQERFYCPERSSGFQQTILKDNGKMVDRTLTAEHAEYDGKANKLHLFQPVKAFDSDGQDIDFEKDAYVGTKEGEETSHHTRQIEAPFQTG